MPFSNQSPAPSSSTATPNTNVQFTYAFVSGGLFFDPDYATVTFSVDGGTPVEVFRGTFTGTLTPGFQTGFSGTLIPETPITAGWTFDINPASDFTTGTDITVNVAGIFSFESPSPYDESYTFTVGAAAPSPITFVFLPETDTFRGGAQCVAAVTGALDTSHDEMLTALPSGWSTAGSVTFDGGAVLRSTAGGTDAALTSASAAYQYFDISVDVEPLTPPPPGDRTATVAAIEHGGLSVRYPFDARGPLTLRFVRCDDYVWGFANGDKVLDEPALALTGTTDSVVLAVRAGSSGTIACRFTNFTVRSHVAINNRLIEDKTQPTPRQIVGTIPASSLSEVGPAVVDVFGLMGAGSASDVFSYILPAPRTVGNEIVRNLRTYQDPVVRD